MPLQDKLFVIPSAVEEARGGKLRIAAESSPKAFRALDDELLTRRLRKRVLPQSFPQLCAVGNTR